MFFFSPLIETRRIIYSHFNSFWRLLINVCRLGKKIRSLNISFGYYVSKKRSVNLTQSMNIISYLLILYIVWYLTYNFLHFNIVYLKYYSDCGLCGVSGGSEKVIL